MQENKYMSTQTIASPPRQETPPFERSASYRSGAPLQQHSSHKNIFQGSHSTNSMAKLSYTLSQHKSSSRKEIEIEESQTVRQKMITMMREQIQISTKFYSEKMKDLLKHQAKQILHLQTQLIANEKVLKDRNKVIEQLLNEKVETPKKKLSITTLTRHNGSPEQQSSAKISQRIEQLESMASKLEEKISQKHQVQAQLNKKIQSIEKGMVKIFSLKLSDCYKKLDRFMSSRDQNMEKIYARAINIQNSAKNANQDNSVELKMNRIVIDVNKLREEILTFARRDFKYENYQVDDLSAQIKDLRNILLRTETKVSNPSSSSTKVVQIDLKKNNSYFLSQQNKYQPYENANQKSQRLSQTQNLAYSNLKATQFTRHQSNADLSAASVNRKKNELYKKTSMPEGSLSVKGNPNKDYLQNNNRSEVPLSSQRVVLQNFQEYENVDSCCSQNQESVEYEDGQNFSEEEDGSYNETRLIQALTTMRYNLPVSVEVDQTGYLKCLKDGMYIVDQNDDGFYLSEIEIDRLVEQGIIKVSNYQ